MSYTFSMYFLKILLLLLLVCGSPRADEWIWMNNWQMNLLKSLEASGFTWLSTLGFFFFFFCIIVVLCKYLLTSSLHRPQCQKQWPISVHSSTPASCSIHHSSPFYWLLPISSIKASSTNHTNKNNISSTLKFLWLLNSLTFPSRQTTGKHHLKALFFSFLFSHPLLTPWHSLYRLLSLHQRVVNNLCQWFLDGKKDGWHPAMYFFLLQKCCSWNITHSMKFHVQTFKAASACYPSKQVQLNEVLICPFLLNNHGKRKERKGEGRNGKEEIFSI